MLSSNQLTKTKDLTESCHLLSNSGGPTACCCAVLSRSVVSDALWPHRLQPTRLLCPWGCPRQEHWSGLPCPPPGDLPNPGIKPRSPASQADSLPTEPPGKPKNTGVSILSLLQWIFVTQEWIRCLLHCRKTFFQPSYQGSPPNSISSTEPRLLAASWQQGGLSALRITTPQHSAVRERAVSLIFLCKRVKKNPFPEHFPGPHHQNSSFQSHWTKPDHVPNPENGHRPAEGGHYLGFHKLWFTWVICGNRTLNKSRLWLRTRRERVLGRHMAVCQNEHHCWARAGFGVRLITLSPISVIS